MSEGSNSSGGLCLNDEGRDLPRGGEGSAAAEHMGLSASDRTPQSNERATEQTPGSTKDLGSARPTGDQSYFSKLSPHQDLASVPHGESAFHHAGSGTSFVSAGEPRKLGGTALAPSQLEGVRVGLVVSDWNRHVTDRLLGGAAKALVQMGISPEDSQRCVMVRVPGAFELAQGALALVSSGDVDAVVALGCVIKGETEHYRYVAEAAAMGLQLVALRTGIPVAFGVLTTDDVEQAYARSEDDPQRNKGYEATMTALSMAATLRELRRVDE